MYDAKGIISEGKKTEMEATLNQNKKISGNLIKPYFSLILNG
jgi:hypothetical protein